MICHHKQNSYSYGYDNHTYKDHGYNDRGYYDLGYNDLGYDSLSYIDFIIKWIIKSWWLYNVNCIEERLQWITI